MTLLPQEGWIRDHLRFWQELSALSRAMGFGSEKSEHVRDGIVLKTLDQIKVIMDHVASEVFSIPVPYDSGWKIIKKNLQWVGMKNHCPRAAGAAAAMVFPDFHYYSLAAQWVELSSPGVSHIS